ncbi:MAG: hypothetical protein HY055_06660, partial [Magnetospirillum sp.]|nr:hypothetical protein [Magnetospirillum sp.]
SDGAVLTLTTISAYSAGIAVDGSGNLYIPDYQAGTIQELGSPAIPVTYPGVSLSVTGASVVPDSYFLGLGNTPTLSLSGGLANVNAVTLGSNAMAAGLTKIMSGSDQNLLVINASAYSNALTVDASADAAGATLIAGTGVETFYGGGGINALSLASIANQTVTISGGTSTVSNNGHADTLIGNTMWVTYNDGSGNLSINNNASQIIGSVGNEVLRVGAGVTYVDGSFGDDTVTLMAGGQTVTVAVTETLIGGSGNDVVTLYDAFTGGSIDLGAGANTLIVSNLSGGTLTDSVFAQVHNVQALAIGNGIPNASLTLSSQAQAAGIALVDVSGTTGYDWIDAGQMGGITLAAGTGYDNFIGSSSGHDVAILQAAEGQTSLSVNGGTFTIFGGATSGSALNSSNLDEVRFNDGHTLAIFAASGSPITVAGGAGSDTIHATYGIDVIDAGSGGNDTLIGGSGNSTNFVFHGGFDASTGHDTVIGGAGRQNVLTMDFTGGTVSVSVADAAFTNVQNVQLLNVVASGAPVNITLGAAASGSGINMVDAHMTDSGVTIDGHAEAGGLNVIGGYGADTFNGGSGNDYFAGGAGTDKAVYHGAMAGYHFGVASGNVSVQDINPTLGGNDGTDLLTGVETLQFTDGSVTLSANGSTLTGGTGADTLDTSMGGFATVNGGAGADVLIAGAGGETLIGGSGNDVFTINSAAASTTAVPTVIADFVSGADKIDLSAGGGGLTYVQGLTWKGTPVASGAALSGLNQNAVAFTTDGTDGWLMVKGGALDGTLIKLAGVTTGPALSDITGAGSLFSPGAVTLTETANVVQFSGSNVIAAPLVSTATTSLTQEAWVKWDGYNSGGSAQFIFYNGDGSFTGSGLFVDGSGHLGFMAGGVILSVSSNAVLTAGQWQHVALVRNSGTFTVNVDGVDYGFPSGNAGIGSDFANHPGGSFIGAAGTGGGEGFHGEIKDVRFWDTARTSSDLSQNMNKIITSSDPAWASLKGYWRLNEGTGSSLADSSGHNNNASFYVDGQAAPVWVDDRGTTPAGAVDGHLQVSSGLGVTLSILTAAQHGTATLDAATGNWHYAPNNGFLGHDSFVVQADNGYGGIATKTITVASTGTGAFNTAPFSPGGVVFDA